MKNVRIMILNEVLQMLNEGVGTFFVELAELAALSEAKNFKNLVAELQNAYASARNVALPEAGAAELKQFCDSTGITYTNILFRDQNKLYIDVATLIEEVKRVSGAANESEAFRYLRNPSDLARDLETSARGVGRAAEKALTLTNIEAVATPEFLNGIAQNYVRNNAATLKSGAGLNVRDFAKNICDELRASDATRDLFRGVSDEGVADFVQGQLPRLEKWVKDNRRRLGAAPPKQWASWFLAEEGTFGREIAKFGQNTGKGALQAVLIILISISVIIALVRSGVSIVSTVSSWFSSDSGSGSSSQQPAPTNTNDNKKKKVSKVSA